MNEQTDEDLQHDMLPSALKELKQEEHLLLSLYYYQDLSVKEISQLTELSESNIKVRLYRARKELHLLLISHMAVNKTIEV